VAHHLAESGSAERAITYWQRAARRALSRSAELEAIEHLQCGLGQLAAVPGGEPRARLEFELTASLGRALSTVRGFTAPETGGAFEHADELGRRLGVGLDYFPCCGDSMLRRICSWLSKLRGSKRQRCGSSGPRPASPGCGRSKIGARNARDLLAPVYGWFTEGFETADLKDAKALLDELR
jgi:hypothetical protein